MDQSGLRDVRRVWRHTSEAWLRRQGLIKVSINGHTVPPFSPRMAS